MRSTSFVTALSLIASACIAAEGCTQAGGGGGVEGCEPCTPGCGCSDGAIDAHLADASDASPSLDGAGEKCGDGECHGSETCATCPADCGTCPNPCGNGSCTAWKDCKNCPVDCGACIASCGDGKGCVAPKTCKTCPTDCGECPAACGDAKCNGTEDCKSCPADCGACVCGDGKGCVAPKTCTNCPSECGGCPPPPPVCGDVKCEGTESCATCNSDCPCEKRVVVKAASIGSGWYAVQCKPGGGRRDVWTSSPSTGDPSWYSIYSFGYDEPSGACPAPTGGHYPIVFTTNLAIPADGSWVIQCTNTPGLAYIYRIDAHDAGGLPLAIFQYPQSSVSECP